MKSIKKILMMLVVIVLVFNTASVQAKSNGHNNGNRTYKDVKEDNWAKKYIDLMSKYKIIDGYGDDTFRPNSTVSRQEFAKMMVYTLGMDLENPKEATFLDVKKSDWGYKFIETAKSYLTGYSSINGLNFKPTLEAQREDMAVAIVKGLNIDVEDTDMDILKTLKDENKISKNLRPYVAAAINEGIMIGDTKKNFKPTESITRAEAATLLARLILEEKVVFDETKIVIDDEEDKDDETRKAPVLTSKVDDDKVVLKWTKADEDEFENYRVVLSKKDSKPAYPSDGYAEKITNINVLGYEIEAEDSYRNGDFGDEIKEGETYYASITVVYKDENVTSNVIKITIPDDDEEERIPTLTSTTVDDKIKLTWTETSDDDFEYYKVVLSKYNTKPSYPNDGYLTKISDEDVVNFVVSPGLNYTGGDAGTLVAGQKYYAAITAVYEDGDIHYTSNVITITLP